MLNIISLESHKLLIRCVLLHKPHVAYATQTFADNPYQTPIVQLGNSIVVD